MCILLTSSAHHEYPFILISNRDEYFKRPTSSVQLHDNIVSPFDLAKSSHGSWIGVTKTGRIGVLVNYQESKTDDSKNNLKFSRGSLVKDFLESKLGPKEYEEELFENHSEELKSVGGFSFLFGDLEIVNGKICPLRIVSNRGVTSEIFLPPNDKDVVRNENDDEILVRERKSYIGLSNSLFLEPWPKVLIGENLLNNLVMNSTCENWSEQKLIKELFKLLSYNSIKHILTETTNSQGLSELMAMEKIRNEMRSSIFIPPLRTKYYDDADYKLSNLVGNYYGTRTQTIILLKKDGTLKYIERTLHTKDQLEEEPFDTTFNFNIFDDEVVEEPDLFERESHYADDENSEHS